MHFPEYTSLEALALAGLIEKKEIHPKEVLEAAIDRIERANPYLNAVIMKMYDRAFEQIEKGLPRGPFTGVPFLLKDLTAQYGGVPTGSGSCLLKQIISKTHSGLTQRYLDAGLVILGKTNTPELGMSGTTESRASGPCRNPWNLAKSPGGSSGGSGAAVASGMVPMAHGTDTGGSIRNPASNCGLFGLKPTRSRIPMGPDLAEPDAGLSVMHALTRTVKDSAALLDATAGPLTGDPWMAPFPKHPFVREVGNAPGRLKIALHFTAHHDVAIDSQCVLAAERAAQLCQDLGHVVQEAKPHMDGERAIDISRITWAVGVLDTVSAAYRTLGQKPDGTGLEWITWELAQKGMEVSALDYHRAIQAIHEMGRDVARFFESYDVVLSPVLSRPPWPLDEYENRYTGPNSYIRTVFDYSPFAWPYNYSGQPAMSLPLHQTPDGLPVGVMFAGRYGDEATLFRLAGQLEQAAPWADKRPKLYFIQSRPR